MTKNSMKYSVDEIDEMRELVMQLHPIQPHTGPAMCDESKLRTYMVNGTTVKELQAQVAEKRNRHEREKLWKEAEREIERRLCSHELWIKALGQKAIYLYMNGAYRYNYRNDVLYCMNCKTADRRKEDRSKSKPEPQLVREKPKPKRWWHL